MKLKPQIYANLLIESLDGKVDTKKVAAGFWRLLQKNNQYKDLAKVLNELEIEYAKKEGKILAKVYSEKALTEIEIADIKQKLSLRGVGLATRQSNNIMISNIIKKNWGGVTVEVDDKIIDLSSKGKIEKLKQSLSS